MAQMFGKYRGIVANNVDPMMIARLQVVVPAIGAEVMSWAMPCSPFAGPDVGLCLVPPIGANVWVEFEAGNVDSPIWSGCFWGQGEYPAEAQVSPPEKVQVLKGYGFKLVANSVGPTGLTIEVSPPMLGRTLRIVLDDSGIRITNQDEVTITLSDTTIDMVSGDHCEFFLTKDLIQLATATPWIRLNPDNVELSSSAANIKMDAVTVNVNNGALEVT